MNVQTALERTDPLPHATQAGAALRIVPQAEVADRAVAHRAVSPIVARGLDLGVISLSLLLTHLLDGSGTVAAGSPVTLSVAIGVPLVSAYASGIDEPQVALSARSVLVRAAIVGLIAAVALALTTSPLAGLRLFAVYGMTVAIGVAGWRLASGRLVAAPGPEPVIVLGAGAVARRYAGLIEAYSAGRHPVLGLVLAEPGRVPLDERDEHRVLGALHDLEEICVREGAAIVVIAEELTAPSRTVTDVLHRLQRRHVTCRAASSFVMGLGQRVPAELVGARDLVAAFERLERGGRRACKRLMDVVLGGLGLAIFAAMCPLLWIVVKVSSPGAFFFSQLRVGRSGRHFRVYKIRTMREAPARERWAGGETHRITWLGAWLRKSRIDEFPQFWNVLRGDMAIVGPRPEQPGITDDLEDRIPLFGLRSLVKPGITGWAQIHNGYASSIEDSRAKLSYDLFYVARYSLWMDIDIMLRTFFVMLFGYGAR